jgi:hypothetical protein
LVPVVAWNSVGWDENRQVDGWTGAYVDLKRKSQRLVDGGIQEERRDVDTDS